MKNNNNNRKWVKLYAENMRYIIKLNLTSREYKVMIYLMTILYEDNFIYSKQKEIAEILDIKQSNISIIIKSLRDKKILIKHNNHLYFNKQIIELPKPKY